MRSILFDLDGVFYQGEQGIPGAESVIQWVNQHNIPHLFLTNTSSRPATALVEKLGRFNIHVDKQQILTPAVAARQWLKQSSIKRIALFLPTASQIEFSDFEQINDPDQTVDAILVGDLGEEWNYKRLNQAFRYLMQPDPPVLVALGMTRYWRAEDGLRLDVGPFVSALTMASGVEPVVSGKPSQMFYQMALQLLDTKARQCIMVGDDIISDTSAAMAMGLLGVQVRTGKFKPEDMQTGIKPDVILDSVVDLPSWWQNNPLNV